MGRVRHYGDELAELDRSAWVGDLTMFDELIASAAATG
jgi:hypothetical protein